MDNKILQPLSNSRDRGNKSNSHRDVRIGGSVRNISRSKDRLQNPYVTSTRERVERPTRMLTEDEMALKFLLPNHISGTFIGSGGHSIRELMEITGADVHISNMPDTYPGTTDRVIYISGSEDAVSQAQSFIWEMLAFIALIPEDEKSKQLWSPKRLSESFGMYDQVQVEGKVTIPIDAAGLIIGRGGSVIKAIAEESGAKVSVNSKDETNITNERIVFISGTAVQCINATSLVLAKLSEDLELAKYPTPGTKYPVSSQINRRVPTTIRNSAPIVNDRIVRPTASMIAVSDVAPLLSSVGAATISASTTITLAVPDHLIGNIVGKQGVLLREIMSLSGAQVTVSNRGEYVEGTSSRLVTIIGTPAAAQTAHTLISNKVQSALE
eukprot:gene19131-24967_t